MLRSPRRSLLRIVAPPQRCVLLVSLTICAAGLAAERVPAPAAPYAEAASAAVSTFEPLGLDDLTAARDQLGRDALAVERLLPPSTTFGQRWLDYLEWSGVTSQLAENATVDFEAGDAVLRRLRSGAPGLEKEPLRRVALSLQRFLAVAELSEYEPDVQRGAYVDALETLAEWLPDRERLLSPRDSYEVERRLRFVSGVAHLGRGEALLAAAAPDIGQTNALVEVDGSLLNRLVARPVNETSPLSDCILGTRIRGVGSTCGSLTVTPLPASGGARLLFRLTGVTHSRTTGVNGPVAIRSDGQTTFTATKIVDLNDRAFRAAPATVGAQTRTQTRGISKIGGGLGSRLIERVARKRVAEKRGQADAIASDRAEGRIGAQLDEQLREQLVDARRRYDDSVTRPLRRRGATPRTLVQRSTDRSLLIEAVQADKGELAAWTAPPAPVGGGPLRVRLHQTAVQNFLGDVLGGAEFWRNEPDGPIGASIVAPPWLDLEDVDPAPEDFKPWRVRLRDERPVSIALVEGRLRFLVHVDDFISDGESKGPKDLLGAYEPMWDGATWRLQRVGRIDVETPPDAPDPSAEETIASGTLSVKLNKDEGGLPSEIEIDPIDLSSRGGAVKRLRLVDIRLADGWAAAAWRAE